MNINGKLIPNNKITKLPLGTKLLVHCIDDPKDDYWCVCTLEKDDDIFYLYECSINGNLTEVKDLDDYCEVFEYNEEDAKRYIKEEPKQIINEISKPPRYVFDKDEMVIMDTQRNWIVCLVGTKRPELVEEKVNELLELANR